MLTGGCSGSELPAVYQEVGMVEPYSNLSSNPRSFKHVQKPKTKLLCLLALTRIAEKGACTKISAYV